MKFHVTQKEGERGKLGEGQPARVELIILTQNSWPIDDQKTSSDDDVEFHNRRPTNRLENSRRYLLTDALQNNRQPGGKLCNSTNKCQGRNELPVRQVAIYAIRLKHSNFSRQKWVTYTSRLQSLSLNETGY